MKLPMPLTPMVPTMMRTATCILVDAKADTKAFDKRIKAFEDQWNGLEIYGTKVNGKLTVTENVADAGGLSSTLQVLKTDMTKPNLKDYFENYADIWKQKASLQYNKYTMVQDVHAPNELRVNQQLKKPS